MKEAIVSRAAMVIPVELRAAADTFIELFNATNTKNPNKAQVAQLREHLQQWPQLGELVVNLNRIAEDRVIEKIGGSEAIKLTISATLRSKRSELGYDTASPLERSLIERVVLCWLHCQAMMHWYQNATDTPHSLTLGMFWERKLSMANVRYLQAVDTLARVRRLAVRTPDILQLNVAHQQVNQVNQVNS